MDVKTREAIMRVVGALALDIRMNWSARVGDRLWTMQRLLYKIGTHDACELAGVITDNEEKIYENGAWFRDWYGPYCACYPEDLETAGVDKDVFLSEYSIEE